MARVIADTDQEHPAAPESNLGIVNSPYNDTIIATYQGADGRHSGSILVAIREVKKEIDRFENANPGEFGCELRPNSR